MSGMSPCREVATVRHNASCAGGRRSNLGTTRNTPKGRRASTSILTSRMSSASRFGPRPQDGMCSKNPLCGSAGLDILAPTLAIQTQSGTHVHSTWM